jgi:hypothetical protein
MFCSITQEGSSSLSPEEVVHWIQDFSRNNEVYDFGFTDSNLNGNLIEFIRLCDHLLFEADEKSQFFGMLNPCNISRDICQKVELAGFSTVLLGIENFSNRTLLKMKKRNSVLDNVKAIKWFGESDINSVYFNIIIDYDCTDVSAVDENITTLQQVRHLLRENIHCDLISFGLERDAKAYEMREQLGFREICNYNFDNSCYPGDKGPLLRFPLLKHSWDSIPEKWKSVASCLEERERGCLRLVKEKHKWLLYDSRESCRRYALESDEGNVLEYLGYCISSISEISKNLYLSKGRVASVLNRLHSINAVMQEGN